MKRMKQFLATGFAVVMIAGSAMVVQAENERRPPACPNCSNGRITTTVKDQGWESTGTYRDCIHYSKGVDEYLVNHIVTTHRCGSCGFSSSDVETLYKWSCKGYN